MTSEEMYSFSSTLPIQVLVCATSGEEREWREFDRGPGYFHIPGECEVGVRIKTIDDAALECLVDEIAGCPVLVSLNLSENRKVTDEGIASLPKLSHLVELNLSSCDLTNRSISSLQGLTHLQRLNLSYCNRLTDEGIKNLKFLNRLVYLDLQGCVKVSNGGLVH
ncbi:MAG TPA: hypothetical protein VMC62_05280, partial [Longilinea sp.]|nr:hypothetical protein [Longilinea sp.]